MDLLDARLTGAGQSRAPVRFCHRGAHSSARLERTLDSYPKPSDVLARAKPQVNRLRNRWKDVLCAAAPCYPSRALPFRSHAWHNCGHD